MKLVKANLATLITIPKVGKTGEFPAPLQVYLSAQKGVLPFL